MLVNRIIETSSAKIAVVDTHPSMSTQMPTLVFLHGHCTNKEFFYNQFQSLLLKEFRLVALDLPGYGKSSEPTTSAAYSFPGFADVVCEVINQLDLQNFIVVGWSLGGHVALELTSRLSKLKGLLITGTPPIEVSVEGLSQGFKISDPKIAACFGKGNLSNEETELFATISGYDYSPEKYFIVKAIQETSEGAKTLYPLSIINGVGQDGSKIVKTWKNPIAVVAGQDDTGINNDYIRDNVEFCNLWNNQVYMIPQAGHAVFLDQPESFNSLLSQFSKEVLL